MYLGMRENIVNGVVQKVLARCQIRSGIPGSDGLASSSTRMVNDESINTKEYAYFFVTVIKSWVLKYVLRASYSSSSEGFGLLLGPANTVVAMEKVEVGRTVLNAGGCPPKLSAGDMARLKVVDMRGSGGGILP